MRRFSHGHLMIRLDADVKLLENRVCVHDSKADRAPFIGCIDVLNFLFGVMRYGNLVGNNLDR